MVHHSSALVRRLACLPLIWTVAVTIAAAVPTPVTWTLLPPKDAVGVRPGGSFEVTARARIERGWYLYGMGQPAGGPTSLRITVPEGQPFVLDGPVGGPEPKRGWDSAFEIETARHDARAVDFTLPLKVAEDARAGGSTLQVQVRFQVCSDTLCLRPRTDTLAVPIEIVAAGEPAATQRSKE